ncbi:hypothetical protein [Paenibacillus harenae]|uniref:hypothetical protein n=1 Tax=Paenibacillus harenae TaxID=306543 RepID=UPI00042216A9|nr:hypothetical protein [Paenibacillus harenae]
MPIIPGRSPSVTIIVIDFGGEVLFNLPEGRPNGPVVIVEGDRLELDLSDPAFE